MRSRHPFKRAERVADLLRQVVSEILMTRVQHLGLEEITVTGARISNDLQHARVYYRLWNPKLREKVSKRLHEVSGTLRKEVGREMKLRHTPTLQFEYDESPEYGGRIDTLLRSLHPSGEE